MSASVHDNHLVAYEVDGERKRITLHTEYQSGGDPFERTDVLFEGVLDHYFRNARFPSILFDVEEVEPKFILLRDQDLLNEGNRTGGWPSFWHDSIDGMAKTIRAEGCKMYAISSSYGLDGWVAAKSCEFQTRSSES